MSCSFTLFVRLLAGLILFVVSITAHPSSRNLQQDNSYFQDVTGNDSIGKYNVFASKLSAAKRTKRTSEHHITECVFMASQEGEYYHKSPPATLSSGAAMDGGGKTCGAYFVSDPDQVIEIRFNYLDIPCENGGLVSVVDGWELNGEYFPSPHDHPKPMRLRFNEFCGQKKIKQIFISSQNAALIQYRMPSPMTSGNSAGFSISVRFLKNPKPCNVLFQDNEGIYTLRNYGKRSNCSLSTIFPAAVKVAALNIGISNMARRLELETGTIHKCQKRGLDDYVQIGGSTGLDNTNLQLADSLCGIDSKPGKQTELIGCETTTIRLVSSGAFDNSVTVAIRILKEDDFTAYMSVICGME